jgi:hypothetical protein
MTSFFPWNPWQINRLFSEFQFFYQRIQQELQNADYRMIKIYYNIITIIMICVLTFFAESVANKIKPWQPEAVK